MFHRFLSGFASIVVCKEPPGEFLAEARCPVVILPTEKALLIRQLNLSLELVKLEDQVRFKSLTGPFLSKSSCTPELIVLPEILLV